jgi:hypothetical protein
MAAQMKTPAEKISWHTEDRPKEKAGEGWEDMVDYVINYEEGGPYVCSLGIFGESVRP